MNVGIVKEFFWVVKNRADNWVAICWLEPITIEYLIVLNRSAVFRPEVCRPFALEPTMKELAFNPVGDLSAAEIATNKLRNDRKICRSSLCRYPQNTRVSEVAVIEFDKLFASRAYSTYHDLASSEVAIEEASFIQPKCATCELSLPEVATFVSAKKLTVLKTDFGKTAIIEAAVEFVSREGFKPFQVCCVSSCAHAIENVPHRANRCNREMISFCKHSSGLRSAFIQKSMSNVNCNCGEFFLVQKRNSFKLCECMFGLRKIRLIQIRSCLSKLFPQLKFLVMLVRVSCKVYGLSRLFDRIFQGICAQPSQSNADDGDDDGHHPTYGLNQTCSLGYELIIGRHPINKRLQSIFPCVEEAWEPVGNAKPQQKDDHQDANSCPNVLHYSPPKNVKTNQNYLADSSNCGLCLVNRELAA